VITGTGYNRPECLDQPLECLERMAWVRKIGLLLKWKCPMTDTASNVPAANDSPKGLRKRLRWSRRLACLFGTLLLLSIVFRILLPLLLPTVLKKVASNYNLEANYERSEFNLLSGDVGLWHLTLTPKGQTDPVFTAGYIRGNISTLRLLTFNLEVWRAEADGVDLTLERDENGKIPLLEQLMTSTVAKEASNAPTTQPALKFDLTPPLQIDALRLTNVRTHFHDKSAHPPFQADAVMNIRLSDLGSMKRPATFELTALSDTLVDQVRVSGVARGSADKVDADGFVVVRGLDLGPVAGYLAPLGIKPISRSISVTGAAKLRVATTQASSALDIAVDLSGMKLNSEGAEAAGVDSIAVRVGEVNGTGARISSVKIDGVRANAQRSDGGQLRLAGIELVPASSSPSTSTTPPLDYRVVVDELKLSNVALGFNDAAIVPSAKIAFNVDDLTLKNLVLDPTNPNAAMQITGTMHAPGIAGGIALNGSAKPGAVEKTTQLKLSVRDIKPDALKPYLDALGLESLIKDASFSADVQAGVKILPAGLAASAALTNIQFADGAELFAMPRVSLQGVSIDTTSGMLDIGTVLLSGPTLLAQREQSGAVQLLGLRFDPGRLPSAKTSASTQPAVLAQSASPALPRLRVGNLQWQDIKLQFTDQTVSPASTISLANAGLELRDLLLDLQSKQAGKPGALKAWIEAPNFAERVDVNGTFIPAPGSFAADISIHGKGVTIAGAKPYLHSLGIEPVLSNGEFKVNINTQLAQAPDSVDVEFGLKDVTFTDAGAELAGLDALSVKNLSLGKEISVASVQIDRPRATVTRLKDGNFQAAGIRTIPVPPSTQPAMPEDPNAPLLPPLVLPLPDVVANVKSLALNGASVRWIDQAMATPVDTVANIDASLNDFVYGKDSPGAFTAAVKLKDSLEALNVTGTIGAAHDRVVLSASAKGNGLRVGALSAYLPPGIQGDLNSGALQATLEASILPSSAGGTAANLAISNVSYVDGDRPFFKLDSFKVIVPRYDPKGGVVQIDEISSAGLALTTSKSADSAIKALGLAIVSAPATQPVAADAPVETPATQPILVATTGPASEDVAAIVARARRPLPAITLNKLDLNVASIKFTDESRAGSAPIELKDLKFANLAPIELGGKDPENRPPAKLQLTGKIDPIVGGINVNTTLAPFAQQPSLTTDVLISGINGEGVIKAMPELATHIDGASLSSGEFKTHVEATAKYQRRGPYDFDLTKGFELALLVKDVGYRASPDTEVLLGLDSLQADSIRVEPMKGNVIAKTIELNKPIARGLRDKDGIHLLGLTVKETPTTQPSEPATQPAEEERGSSKPLVLATGPRPSNEIRIDKFLISGADIKVEDRTTNPGLILPITGLDVEVKGLSNQALYEEKPIKFSALVNSGKITLPKMTKSGLDENTPEERDVFSQIASTGNIVLYPKLGGWAKTSVNGFDMLSLRGPASAAGVNIGGGMYDSTIDARVNDTGKIDLRMRHIVTNLKMTEGDDGPIRKALKLPSPLNVVIGMLEDPDSSITLPVSVSIDQGEIKGIGGAAAGAVSSVILTAVASAPVKAVGGVTGLMGLNKKGKPIDPVMLGFASGDTILNAKDLASLDPMLAVLRKEKTAELTLKGELGGGDVIRASGRANPPISDVSSIASSLREEKLSLLAERSNLAGAAKAQIATGDSQSSATLTRIRDLDRQIATVEDAMDSTYDLLRPGAEKQADRRTRAAALSIASERMDELRKAILTYAKLPEDSDRVRVIRPTFSPAENDAGGSITVTLVAKKKE
jgi:hypothetical protein